MPTKKYGRPLAITPSIVSKLEQALRDGFSIEMACHVSGISRSTYYARLQTDEEFSDKMALSQAWATERAKQVIIQAINNGDIKSSQWWLERRARAEFATNPPQVQDNQPRDSLFGDYSKETFIEYMAKLVASIHPTPPTSEQVNVIAET